MDEIERLEARLRALDEEIARLRHELIWRKREVRPGYEPAGIPEAEARYLQLSAEFTETWERWRAANEAADAAWSEQSAFSPPSQGREGPNS
ncbi:MAG: hypothetical protein RMM58_09465 [Chloroflexota bacterium]|nr:hypothetical protein [Dehalococcoidia bacterium]MDW8254095.1 hypothetical protein [Chloroflexota bacterium]